MFFFKKSPCLILPVETKVRELHAKTLLACLAVSKGFQVILGESHLVRDYASHYPAGFFMDKSLAPTRADLFKNYIYYGHRVLAWCEEGLVFYDDRNYLRRKVHKESLRSVGGFFAWGPYQADLIREHFPEFKDRVFPTGNPRFDVLRSQFHILFDSNVQDLKKRYGDYILINTNFAACNFKLKDESYLDNLKKTGRITNEEEEEFTIGFIEYRKRIMDYFVLMIRDISSAFPEKNIVIRPHPSEDHNTWKNIFKESKNIHVVHAGSVIPWILASSVLIHNGCTTGIEARILKKNAISFVPVSSRDYDMYLPNAISFAAKTNRDVIFSLEKISESRGQHNLHENSEEINVLEKYISGMSDSKLASENILEKIMAIDAGGMKSRNRRPWFFLHHLLGVGNYLRLQIRLNQLLAGKQRNNMHQAQKFPDLQKDELENICFQIQQALNVSRTTKVEQVADKLFLLSPAS